MVDYIVELSKKLSLLTDSFEKEWWVLHMNRASRVSSSGVGLILQSPDSCPIGVSADSCPAGAP